MRIKKALALILALTMCLCMFAVMPTVSAAGSSLWEVLNPGGYRNDSGHEAPEGYEWIRVDGNTKSNLVTKEKYDALENTIVLSNLTVPVNGAIAFEVAPSKTNFGVAPENNSNLLSGTIGFRLKNKGNGLEYGVYVYDNGNFGIFDNSSNLGQDTVIPYADEYKIGFVNDQGTIKFHVNDWWTSSQWATYGVRGDYSEANDYERYITISCAITASAYVKICDNDDLDDSAWENIAKENGYRAGDGSAVPPAGYEYIEVDSSANSHLATKRTYDIRETSIVLSNLNVLNDDNKFIEFIFAPHQAKLYEEPANKNGAAAGFFIFRLYNTGSNLRYQVVVYNAGDGPHPFSNETFGAGTCDIPYAEEYEISLLYTADGYKLRINNWYMTRWLNGLTGAYSDSNGYERYITVATNYNSGVSANVKLVNNDDIRSRWVACVGKLKDYSGNVTGYDATRIKIKQDEVRVASLARYNMLENTLVLDDIEFPPKTGGSQTKITFSAKTRFASDGGIYDASERKITFNFEPYEYVDNDGNGTYETVTKIRVAMANWTLQYPLKLTNRYEIGFRNINGTYYLYLNDEKITNDHIQGFCAAGYAENCYIGFKAANYLCADMTVIENTSLFFPSHSLTLADSIGVNFVMNLSRLTAAEKPDSYVTFAIGNSETVKRVDFANATVSGDNFRFTCPLSSVQMAETVTPTFHYGNGEVLCGNSFSLSDYTGYVIANSENFSESVVDYATQLSDCVSFIATIDRVDDGIIDILDLVQAEMDSVNDDYLSDLGQIIMEIYKYLDLEEDVLLPET